MNIQDEEINSYYSEEEDDSYYSEEENTVIVVIDACFDVKIKFKEYPVVIGENDYECFNNNNLIEFMETYPSIIEFFKEYTTMKNPIELAGWALAMCFAVAHVHLKTNATKHKIRAIIKNCPDLLDYSDEIRTWIKYILEQSSIHETLSK